MSATRLDSELLQHANLHFVYICFPTRGITYESHEATPPPLLLHTAAFDVYLRFTDIDVELSRQIQHCTSSSPRRQTCRVWSRSDELPSRCVSNRRTDLLFHNLMKERDEEDLIWDVLIIILMLCSQVNAAFFTLHSVSIQVVSFLQETEKPCNPPAFSSSWRWVLTLNTVSPASNQQLATHPQPRLCSRDNCSSHRWHHTTKIPPGRTPKGTRPSPNRDKTQQ